MFFCLFVFFLRQIYDDDLILWNLDDKINDGLLETMSQGATKTALVFFRMLIENPR